MELIRILVVLILLSSAFAEAKTLSWLEAVALAQKNSLELQAAEMSYQATKSLETSAESGFYPRIAGNLSEARAGSKSADSSDTYGAQLSLSQNIFAGFADLNRSR